MWLWFKIIDPQQNLMAMRLWFMIMLIISYMFVPFDTLFDYNVVANLHSSLNFNKNSWEAPTFVFIMFPPISSSPSMSGNSNFPKETPWKQQISLSWTFKLNHEFRQPRQRVLWHQESPAKRCIINMTTTNTAAGFGRNQITQIAVSQLFANIFSAWSSLDMITAI